jgi:hypothetical protein
MPRYYFDLRADGITIPAREEAARAAGEMMRERSARNAEPQDIAQACNLLPTGLCARGDPGHAQRRLQE